MNTATLNINGTTLTQPVTLPLEGNVWLTLPRADKLLNARLTLQSAPAEGVTAPAEGVTAPAEGVTHEVTGQSGGMAMASDASNTWLQLTLTQECAITKLVLKRTADEVSKKQGVRIRILSAGNWLPLSPRDTFEFPTKTDKLTAQFPAVAASAVMLDFLTEMQIEGKEKDGKSTTIGNGILIPGAVALTQADSKLHSTGQACHVSLAIGDEEPFFHYPGVLPNNTAVPITGLCRALNRYLQDNPGETCIPITLQAASNAKVTLNDLKIEQATEQTPAGAGKPPTQNLVAQSTALLQTLQQAKARATGDQQTQVDDALTMAQQLAKACQPLDFTPTTQEAQSANIAASLATLKTLISSNQTAPAPAVQTTAIATLLTRSQAALLQAQTALQQAAQYAAASKQDWQPMLTAPQASKGRLCCLSYVAAQGFEVKSPQVLQVLQAVRLYLRTVGNPTANPQAKLCLHHGNADQVGAVFIELPPVPLIHPDADWQTFKLPQPLTLPVGHYWWVLQSTDEEQKLLWYQHNTVPSASDSLTIGKTAYRIPQGDWQMLSATDEISWLQHQLQLEIPVSAT